MPSISDRLAYLPLKMSRPDATSVLFRHHLFAIIASTMYHCHQLSVELTQPLYHEELAVPAGCHILDDSQRCLPSSLDLGLT